MTLCIFYILNNISIKEIRIKFMGNFRHEFIVYSDKNNRFDLVQQLPYWIYVLEYYAIQAPNLSFGIPYHPFSSSAFRPGHICASLSPPRIHTRWPICLRRWCIARNSCPCPWTKRGKIRKKFGKWLWQPIKRNIIILLKNERLENFKLTCFSKDLHEIPHEKMIKSK